MFARGHRVAAAHDGGAGQAPHLLTPEMHRESLALAFAGNIESPGP